MAVASSGLKRPTGPLPFSHSGLAAIVVPMIAIPTVVVLTAMASVPTVMPIPPNFLNGINLGHVDLQSHPKTRVPLARSPNEAVTAKAAARIAYFINYSLVDILSTVASCRWAQAQFVYSFSIPPV
jgi:hypothetical protein